VSESPMALIPRLMQNGALDSYRIINASGKRACVAIILRPSATNTSSPPRSLEDLGRNPHKLMSSEVSKYIRAGR